MSRPRFVVTGVAAVLALSLACSRQTANPTSPSALAAANGTGAAADGSTLKATAPVPVSPVNDAQVNDLPTLTATASTMKFTDPVPLQYRFEVFNEAGVKVQDSGLVNSPSFKVTATLSFRRRHTWRARAEREGAAGPWSTTGSFVSAEGGYIRGNEVFDPLYNGATVGERDRPHDIPSRQRDPSRFHQLVRAVSDSPDLTSGEFSMEVEGLQTNASGDKSKVFGMMEGTGEYITNPYRVDIQYRGTRRLSAECDHVPCALRIRRRSRRQVRTPDSRTVRLGACPQSIDDVFLEMDLGQRGPADRERRRHQRPDDL